MATNLTDDKSSFIDEDIFKQDLSKLVVGAHPDDVEIFCTSLMNRTVKNNTPLVVVYTTNGAPKYKEFYPLSNCSNPLEYTVLRKKESIEALSAIGIKEAEFFDFSDQELIENLEDAVNNLSKLILKHKPELLFTPAYEGGHPDHDATRFITQMAIEQNTHQPVLCEYPTYNKFDGKNYYQIFIPNGGKEIELILTGKEIILKNKIFEIFKSQKKSITPFRSLIREVFRIAQKIDFTKPPHEGELYYESIDIIKVKPEQVINAFSNYLKTNS